MTETNQPQKHHKPSIFGPLLLITLGAAFLLNNLGFISGNLWDTIIKLWPLLIVFSGLNDLFRREGVVWPLILIGLGTFLLLINFDYLTWHSWGRLWKLWPLILVAIGVDLIFKERPVWRAILGGIMILLLVGGGIWLASFSSQVGISQPVEAAQPLGDDISKARLTISLSAGELLIEEGAQKGMLLDGEIPQKTGYEHYSETNGIATYTLNSSTSQISPSHGLWDIKLTTQIPIDLNAEMGAGEMVLELEELKPENLVVKQGVGDIKLRLPLGTLTQGPLQVEVNQAIGQIQIRIPNGASVRIEVSKALSNLNIPQNFSRRGDYYYSPNYTEGDVGIELNISQAIGNIDIKYTD